MILGQIVQVVIDRPMGSYHSEHPDLYYEVNYGYVPGVFAPDGEEQDAYVLGVEEPLERFCGKVIAIIRRKNDDETKWVVAPENCTFTAKEVMQKVHFQERFFDSWIQMEPKKRESKMSEHDGHRKRLRERANSTGLEGFQAHEVMELLLSETIPRKDVNPLAHELIDHFGSLAGVLDARKEELMQVKGVGERTAAHLALQVEILRYYQRDRWGEKPRLNNRYEAGEYCTALFGRQQVEAMRLVCLDVHKSVLASEVIAVGTVDETPVYPRTVVEAALRYHAHSVILVHNHPSGEVEPSQGDVYVSAQVERALRLVNIDLLDHIIVAGDRYTSLCDMGLVPTLKPRADVQPDRQEMRKKVPFPLPTRNAADSDDPL